MSTNLFLLFMITTAQYHLPQGLLSSLCYVESKHRVEAIHYDDGGADSLGVCQIKMQSARQMGFEGTPQELMIPENNIKYAGAYLAWEIKRYHSVKKGVIAYNRGNAKSLTISEYQVKVYNIWRGY